MTTKDQSYDKLGVALGEAIVKYACRAWIGPVADIGTGPILSFAKDKLSSSMDRRKIKRFWDSCIDAVAEKSIKFIELDGGHLPANELQAAVIAVRATFNRAAKPDLFRHDLDSSKLREHLEQLAIPVLERALLNEAATEFFHILLSEACTYAVEFATTLPKYQDSVFKEILRRQTAILEYLNTLLNLMPKRDPTDEFLTYYRRQIAKKFDRMEPFGVDFSNKAYRYYPLSVAFINLSAAKKSGPSKTQISATVGSLRVERVISENKNILIVGEAGSGKTTLLRWVAVQASRRSFERQLEIWNATFHS
jgi:ABC-type multidrug transport system fused ATPase/permease subunit